MLVTWRPHASLPSWLLPLCTVPLKRCLYNSWLAPFAGPTKCETMASTFLSSSLSASIGSDSSDSLVWSTTTANLSTLRLRPSSVTLVPQPPVDPTSSISLSSLSSISSCVDGSATSLFHRPDLDRSGLKIPSLIWPIRWTSSSRLPEMPSQRGHLLSIELPRCPWAWCGSPVCVCISPPQLPSLAMIRP